MIVRASSFEWTFAPRLIWLFQSFFKVFATLLIAISFQFVLPEYTTQYGFSVSRAHAQALVCGQPEATGVGGQIIPFDMTGLTVSAGTPNSSKTLTLPDGRVITVATQYISGGSWTNFAITNARPAGKFLPQMNGVRGMRTTDRTNPSVMRVTISPAANIIVGDAETMSASEQITVTTNGGVWEQIDGTSPDDNLIVTGLETSTLVTVGSGSPARVDNDFILPVTRNASQLDVRVDNLVAGGLTGFFLAFVGSDGGDAPASYGLAQHGTNQFTNCDTYGSAAPHLGALFPDGEDPTLIQTADATGDNTLNTGVAGDEDGVSSIPTISGIATSYTLPAANVTGVGSGSLSAWIDFDNSGTFDTDEYATVLFSNGASTDLVWSSVPTGGYTGNTLARFRVTSTALTASQAATFSSDGEVEDYQVLIFDPITADDETVITPVDTTTDQLSVVNVLDGDLLNGVQALDADVTLAPVNPLPAGFTLNQDGTVDVAANTPSGDYTFDYTICEDGVTPANCAQATVTIPVVGPITADDETVITSVDTTTDQFSVVNVLDGDLLNGVQALDADVTLAPVNPLPAGFTLNQDGTVDVAANTPSGDYTFDYTICEDGVTPVNCAQATVTIPVVGSIVAQDDVVTGVNGLTGNSNAADVLADNDNGTDTLNGVATTFATTDITSVTPATPNNTGDLVPVLNPATGIVGVPAGTPAGTYTIGYTLCESANPTNCDPATVTVTVDAAPIVAANDTPPAVDGLVGNPNVINAFDNDTLGGNPVDPADITATITTSANPATPGAPVPSMDPATGTVSVPPSTPAGLYDIVYEICEILNPNTCNPATVTVVVSPSEILAVDDTLTASVDTAFPLTNVVNVLSGDTLAGEPATSGTVTVSPVGTLPTGFTLNADGSVDIDQFTPSGVYTFDYQVCETLNTANCDVATVTIPVEKSVPAVSGKVFLDQNGNGIFDAGIDPIQGGFLVELVNDAGVVVGTATSGPDGSYEIAGFPVGGPYKIIFTDPSTGISIGGISDLVFGPNDVIEDQNQPIDPSGVIYNSATGTPIAGVDVTLTTATGTPLPAACLLPGQQPQTTSSDGGYRFDVVPGSDALCPTGETEYQLSVVSPAGFENGPSTVTAPQPGALDATTCPADAVPGGACQLSASSTAPSATAPTPYYLAFLLEPGDPNVINNHIPLDPFASIPAAGLSVMKTAGQTIVQRGGNAAYTIEVANTNLFAAGPVDVVDALPTGFTYLTGSAEIDGVATEPTINGRSLTFAGQTVPANGSLTITLTARVPASAEPGDHVNVANVINPATGNPLAEAGRATVRIEIEHVFDCGEVVGKVFDDKNQNGVQDNEERGLPGVRVATVKGLLITTDKYGRYSVPCAALPAAGTGSNFILKLDTRTLPTGYRMTTENPRAVRLTRGKVTKLNFGATISSVVTIDLSARAFVSGSSEPKAGVDGVLNKIIGKLKQKQSTLRLNYYHAKGDRKAGSKRLARIEKIMRSKWKRSGNYKLSIERRVVGAK